MADEHFVGAAPQPQQQQQQQQQRPAPSPSNSQGFFTALLSPLYSSPRTNGNAASTGIDPHSTTSHSSQETWGGNGRSSTTSTPSASPTTSTPNARHVAEMNSAPLALAPTGAADNSAPNSGVRGSGARQRTGFLPSRFYFADSAIVPADGSVPASTHSGDVSASSSSSHRGALSHPTNNRSSAAVAGYGAVHGATAPSPQPHAASNATAQQQQQHGSGACAPHMLGYRQCLEVNPDFKTNCTWALDNYMRCKEDTEL